ncbi:MAG: hypothetical protein H6Q84_1564, partial [Deltaproteobacteria bacterium]|nr:hypothetical protein [Deltaproteobacteria bacterium]
AACRYVPSRGVRIATLIHDFAEGVCAGWEGFSDMGENERLFSEIGFRGREGNHGKTNFLDGTLWVLEK